MLDPFGGAIEHLEWLLSYCKQTEDDEPPERPEWNRKSGQLSFGGRLAKKLRVSVATNQVAVLDAFSSAGWPETIRDPLKNGPDEQRLRNTLRDLNHGLAELKFRTVHREGVLWEVCGRSVE